MKFFIVLRGGGDKGNFEEALELCDEALSLAADDEVLHLVRGLALEALNRTEEARECFENALSLAPNTDSGKQLKSKKIKGFSSSHFCFSLSFI